MVAKHWFRFGSATVALVCVQSAGRCQGTLEGLQKDIARVVRKARPSVVTIVDTGNLPRHASLTAAVTTPGEDAALLKARYEDDAFVRVLSDHLSRRYQALNALPLSQRVLFGYPYPDPGDKAPHLGAIFYPSRLRATGFSIPGGYVVTAADTLETMDRPFVLTDSGIAMAATVVGVDQTASVGVLKVDSPAEIPPLPWAEPGAVEPGQFAISIADFAGITNAASLSIVSGVESAAAEHGAAPRVDFIQIPGAAGPGSGGGPLLNAEGKVIGMVVATFGVPAYQHDDFAIRVSRPADSHGNSSIMVGRGGVNFVPSLDDMPRRPGAGEPSAGVTYAVPSQTVELAVRELVKQLADSRGWLGLTASQLTMEQTQGTTVRTVPVVAIRHVLADSPAAAAGLRFGDIITYLGGRRVTSAADIRKVSLTCKPGDSIEVEAERGARNIKATLIVTPRPINIKRVYVGESGRVMPDRAAH